MDIIEVLCILIENENAYSKGEKTKKESYLSKIIFFDSEYPLDINL